MHSKRSSLFFVAMLIGCSTATIDPDCSNLGQRYGETLECCEAGAIIPLKDIADCPSSVGVNEENMKIWCFSQCNFEALGLLNGDEINEDKLFEYVNRLDGPWKEEAKDAVSDCLDKLAAINIQMAESKNTLPCHHAAGVISSCLIRKTIDLCPYADWRHSLYCLKLRTDYCFKNRYLQQNHE
ncbi:uncharacterized protein LOC126576904 [Anopheles aquasalis]|uniref:uncharacterized protein LOC126576904 n=1 Tax=Anopheles aquasalis TaxID=42839 RepID=UPI00215B009F|nr:uncharacterized protein LOC126576904 [Anopheles aquasalis]